MARCRAARLGEAVAVLLLLLPAVVQALDACTAADIVRQDPACPPGTGPCTINKDFNIANECVLDFEGRVVTLAGNLVIGSNVITLKAGALTIVPGGFIDGRAFDNPDATGGVVNIETVGAVTLQRNGVINGRIDLSGGGGAGTLDVKAGGSVTIAGRINIDEPDGVSACLFITAVGDITTFPLSTISAVGSASGNGGDVVFTAGGNIALGDELVMTGQTGGNVTLTAGGSVATRAIRVNSSAEGDGGTATITAESINVGGVINARGDNGGGTGGTISLETASADLTVGANLFAEGGEPDGTGGTISLSSDLGVTIPAGVTVSARSNGFGAGTGGCIDITANTVISVAGFIDDSGGGFGGGVTINSRGDIAINGSIDVSGRTDNSAGGMLTVEAGVEARGRLTVGGTLDVTARGCDSEGCGTGGSTDLTACVIQISSSANITANAPNGGTNDLTVRESLTLSGTMRAVKTMPSGEDGANTITYRGSTPPVIPAGKVIPAAELIARATCETTDETLCLNPCPVCGDGVVAFPETCDRGVAITGCCNSGCQVEDCNDALTCTNDSCLPLVGCRHSAAPPPCTEPPTPTPSATPTPSSTPVDIRLSPQVSSIPPGGVVDVEIHVEPNDQPINFVSVAINFDSSVVTVQCVANNPNNCLTRGSTLPFVAQNVVDNVTGRIDYRAFTFGQRVGSPFTLATIRFVASANPAHPSTGLEFVNKRDQSGTRSTDASVFSGSSYFHDAIDGLIAVGSEVPTNTPSPTPLPTAILMPSPTATTLRPCPGDCDGGGEVTVDEVVRGVNIALGIALVTNCEPFDTNHDGEVTVNEVVAAVNAALTGCPEG